MMRRDRLRRGCHSHGALMPYQHWDLQANHAPLRQLNLAKWATTLPRLGATSPASGLPWRGLWLRRQSRRAIGCREWTAELLRVSSHRRRWGPPLCLAHRSPHLVAMVSQDHLQQPALFQALILCSTLLRRTGMGRIWWAILELAVLCHHPAHHPLTTGMLRCGREVQRQRKCWRGKKSRAAELLVSQVLRLETRTRAAETKRMA